MEEQALYQTESFQSVGIYGRYLFPAEIEILEKIKKTSHYMFDVGDIAEQVLKRHENDGVPKMVLLHLIGQLAGIGGRRVEQLRRVAGAFPMEVRAEYQDMPHTYFETAFAFPTEERINLLEFCKFWFDEKGMWPGADNLPTLFMSQAQGKELGHPYVGELSPINDPPCPPEPPDPLHVQEEQYKPSWIARSRIKALANNWRESPPDSIEDAIEELEAL